MTEIRDILLAALEDVNESGVPDDLREVAFAKAVDLRAGVKPPGTGVGSTSFGSTPESEESDALGRIAKQLGLDKAVAGDIFHDQDGDIELIVSPSKLSPKAARGTKEVALLLVAGRQAAGIEEWTPLSKIREVCELFKKLDGPNFSSALKEMENVFSFRGSSRQREVKMARPGWEEASAFVQKLAGT